MGVHTLVTGLNGAGKTLYTVADKLLPLSRSVIKYKGVDIPRRLVVGGIPDLLLPHELVEVPELDPETYVDEWSHVKRERGDPPVRFVRRELVDVGKKDRELRFMRCDEEDVGAEPILWSALNWWAWCEPGDVIVFDECQRLFRPMASGRRVPTFIMKLETARHYGVEFIYLTQFAGLLHANVRGLVGPHEDVQRMFGTGRTMIYLWEKINVAGNKQKATARYWKHDKAAFGLYKSSELHTKFGQRLPVAIWALLVGLVALATIAWVLKGRLQERFSPPVAAAKAASSPVGQQTVVAGGAPPRVGLGRFPVYDAEPVRNDREPLAGRALYLEGAWSVNGRAFAMFGIVQDGERVASMSLEQLLRMGYTFTEFGPCVALLRFKGGERPVSCGPRGLPKVEPPGAPAAATSAPAA